VIVYSNSIYASLFEEEYCRLAARPHTGHFLTITTGAFAPVGPLLAPVVKHDFQMSWALLIISKRLTLLKKLYLPAFSYPLTFSTFPSYKSPPQAAAELKLGCGCGTPPIFR
jgi:hypothetical protein